MVHFYGTDYRAHTSCISEAQKYQGHLYKDKKGAKGDNRQKSMPGGFPDDSRAMAPRSSRATSQVRTESYVRSQ